MRSLAHRVPDCTGEWERLRRAGRIRWRCTRCRAAVRETPSVAVQALRENRLGFYLQRLEREGRPVVLVERLPVPGAPFVVQLRPDAAQQDVILLPADAKLFSEAVQMLLVARQAGGDTPTTAATMRVRPQRGRTTSRAVFPWAQRVLGDLRRAEARPVEGIGTVQAVETWLPRQFGRGRP